jgi:integrase
MPDLSVYPRKGSPFFYISYPCPKRLKRVHEATPFRTDDDRGERKAYLLAKDKSEGASILMKGAKAERFDTWVTDWLRVNYRNPKTVLRYTGAWEQWRRFLIDRAQIAVPRALTYQHVLDFHAWRTSQVKKSGRKVGSNTAISDIKFMQACITEAQRRGFADDNPCKKLGIQKDPARRAHRLMPDELARVEATLPAFIAEEPERRTWMAAAYTIARYQGCRLRETRLNLRSQVDLFGGTITFSAKGSNGQPSVFTTQMHQKVRPLMERLIAEKRAYTLEFPVCPSIFWRRFFDQIGLRNAWFHCLRSTVATEMAVAGVPISLAMRYQGHAKEEIHRAYQDIKAKDLTVCAAAVG